MLSELIQAVGGLGLFLLGMSIMTEGLRALADDKLHDLLSRSTKSPIAGVCTGTITTAMVQSSSATTVAAVGFVHAGLLTFTQALGVIFGANIGTTITGWMVALVGFKLQLGEVMLPVILVGTLVRLTCKGRLRAVGTALAGFGLIFVGITALQHGMAGFQGYVTPESLPSDTVVGRILLVMIGIVITLVTQSSSAGVATALAAVHTNTITLSQAAAMVIGMDVGTTITAALATIGANVPAKRTGLAHVFYNCLTAIGALALLTPYFTVLTWLWPNVQSTDAELALVGFHTFFNGLGVLAILPFTRAFAKAIERIIPERELTLTRRLDKSVKSSPDVALDAVITTLRDITRSMLRVVSPVLSTEQTSVDRDALSEIDEAIQATREYLGGLVVDTSRTEQFARYTNAIHTLDHLQRISRRARDKRRLSRARADSGLSAMTDLLLEAIRQLELADFPIDEATEAAIQESNEKLKAAMRRYRLRTLRQTAGGTLSTQAVLKRMDTARCLRRIGYHIWRIADHGSTRPIDQHTEP